VNTPPIIIDNNKLANILIKKLLMKNASTYSLSTIYRYNIVLTLHLNATLEVYKHWERRKKSSHDHSWKKQIRGFLTSMMLE